jgi:hypothetical protein
MPRTKRIWTDGLKPLKTATNPKGGGRVAGRDYSYLTIYPGLQAEHRLSYCRMKAQAKFRQKQGRPGEGWHLTWEEYQKLWEGLWHLRGTTKESYVLTKRDQELDWTVDNVEVCPRLEQWRRQSKTSK